MTALLITVDTELSALLHQRGVALDANVASSIWGRHGQASGQDVGIGWQMDMLDRHGLKGVFFLDPLPALVHGPDFLRPIVSAILGRGHEVQLHAHTEWLAWADKSPVKGRQGRNIGDFSLDHQIVLLDLGRTMLEQAGAASITAFRAGNYGANDDTLRALAAIGLSWDSSVNPAYLGSGCDIGLPSDLIGPTRRLGAAELPISGIADRPGGFRPAQVCAMSAREMAAGLRHAARHGHDSFVVVTHSFEMLSRDRKRPNRTVMRRFEQLCRLAQRLPEVRSSGFADLPPDLPERGAARELTRVAPDRLRTVQRMVEQAWATWRYERRAAPA
ncbi:hypothetical protein WG907_00030 [Sphingobium sp. AN558]|uniref:polysaccharide deacetylase family protein n=1 Tax=Sphingobium sp. AN558 TaxID=3133442 RepID=UPI0030C6277B